MLPPSLSSTVREKKREEGGIGRTELCSRAREKEKAIIHYHGALTASLVREEKSCRRVPWDSSNARKEERNTSRGTVRISRS